MSTNYGRDISCTTGLRTGRFAVGARLVAEAAYRRLTTPRGMLRGGEDEDNYGLDLLDLIGSASTKADAAALPGRITAELKKDERILTVDVVVTPTSNGVSTSFNIQIAAETVAGVFDLVLAVSDVTVELLGIKVES